MVQPLSTTDGLRKCVSRGGVVPGLAAKLFWATSPQSPALDRSSHLLGIPAGAGGPDTALQKRTNGEIRRLWSEFRPTRDRTAERPVNLRRRYVYIIQAGAYIRR